VVSAVLRRSPVETRRDGDAAIAKPSGERYREFTSAGDAFVSAHCTQSPRITAKIRNEGGEISFRSRPGTVHNAFERGE
jgi:hypothetical protein